MVMEIGEDVNTFKVHGGHFMQFPRLIFPLSREDASKCVVEWLKKTAEALETLHAVGLAHLDIRLENVGFRLTPDDVTAVLIDLDTVSSFDCPSSSLSMASRMSQRPIKLTESDNMNLDWKQLGIAASYVASYPTPVNHSQYHSPEFVFQDGVKDSFLDKLVEEGQSKT